MGFFSDTERQEVKADIIKHLGLTAEELEQASDFKLFTLYLQFKNMDGWHF